MDIPGYGCLGNHIYPYVSSVLHQYSPLSSVTTYILLLKVEISWPAGYSSTSGRHIYMHAFAYISLPKIGNSAWK